MCVQVLLLCACRCCCYVQVVAVCNGAWRGVFAWCMMVVMWWEQVVV